MKIVLVASKYLPEYTGAAFRLHTLYRSLLEQTPDWRVNVLCGGIEQISRTEYGLDGIMVHRVRSRAPGAKTRAGRVLCEWLDMIETWRILPTFSADIVHTVGASPVVAAAIHYARLKKLPFLVEQVTPGTAPDQALPLLGRLWRPDIHRGGAIVAISDPIAEECKARGYERNVWSRPNPVDTARFFPEHARRDEYRASLSSFSSGDVVIVAVAKFMPRKNQIFLIDVIARLDERFKLILAGPYVAEGALADRDRAYYKNLQARIRALGVAERVLLVPDFVAADRYIKAADIFAMPIVEEGFGTPILEAQACGVPVIANSAVPAFRPHIKDGESGYLRPLDVEAWADAARSAMTLKREKLLQQASEIVNRYSFAAARDSYRRILTRLRTLPATEEIDLAAVLQADASVA